jgi:hypothetical protein
MGHVSFNRIFAGYGTACTNKKEIDRKALQSSQADKPQPVKLMVLTPGSTSLEWFMEWYGNKVQENTRRQIKPLELLSDMTSYVGKHKFDLIESMRPVMR